MHDTGDGPAGRDDGSTSNDGGGDAAETEEADGCPKCGCEEVATDRTTTGVREGVVGPATGADTFVVVTCERCGYTEFYDVGGESVAVDLFLGREYVPPGERQRATRKSSGDLFFCATCGNAFADETAAECPNCGREFV